MQGDAGGLWWYVRHLPVVGRVSSHPFRLLPFFVLFASLAGGMVLERTLRRTARRRLWEVVLGVGLGSVLSYHVWLATPSFYSYGFRPYPVLPDPLKKLLSVPDCPTGRIMSWSPVRFTNPASGLSLFNALPGAYGVPAFHGYDPLVENSVPYIDAVVNLRLYPLQAARVYGLRWHLLAHGLGPVRAADGNLFVMEIRKLQEDAYDSLKPFDVPEGDGLSDFRPVFNADGVRMVELADYVDPLAFASKHPEQPLPLRMHAGGLDVDTSTAGSQTVVVNFLWRPEMTAQIDGWDVDCKYDKWFRIKVKVPLDGKKLEIRYNPNWTQGFVFGCAFLLLGVGVLLGLRRLS